MTKVLVLIFFCLGFIGILNHAMWRDEINVWLIARDSESLFELFRNIKYEGHPGLWYLCLFLLNQFTSNPVAMQIFHLFLATGFVYLFVKYSPFTPLQKTLFFLGYFPIYEYLLISRNYAIGILLVFSFCTLFPTRQKTYIFLSLILFFLANSNAYCLLIAIALGLTLIVEYSLSKKITNSLAASRSDALCSLIIFCLGVVISIAQLIPPADSTLQGGLTRWILQFDLTHLAKALTRIWNGYILIVLPSGRCFDQVIIALLSLFLVAFAATLLIRKPLALFLYLFGTLEIFLFTYVKFLGSARHYGHFYILLLVSLWISSYYPKSNLLIPQNQFFPKRVQQGFRIWMGFVKEYKKAFLIVILSAQLVAGIFAFSRDLLVPYSASREAARFMQSQKLDKMFIVGSRDAFVSPLCGYLNRKIYYPERAGIGSFVLFNSQRRELNSVAILEQVSQIIKEKQINVLLVLSRELDTSRADIQVSPLSKFTKSFITDERYYLYLVKSIISN